jgi:hypothetical protein
VHVFLLINCHVKIIIPINHIIYRKGNRTARTLDLLFAVAAIKRPLESPQKDAMSNAASDDAEKVSFSPQGDIFNKQRFA